jgi:endonuclease III
MDRKIRKIISLLEGSIPDPRVELEYSNSFELLIAAILSAQCTDRRVNEVTGRLFRRCRTPSDYVKRGAAALEKAIRPTGYYRSKTRSILGLCRKLEEEFGGNVPSSLEELTSLPGVGRKTANLILGHAFNEQAIPVDTHVKRVAYRLGLTGSEKPDRVERDLCAAIPEKMWTDTATRLVLHGRRTCRARRPLCRVCMLEELCPKEGL